MRLIDRFSGIKAAALNIAYDNGMVNRFWSEKSVLDGVENLLQVQSPTLDFLERADAFLHGLSEDDLMTLCAGEESDMKAILLRAPPEIQTKLNNLLNDVFEYDYPLVPDTTFYTEEEVDVPD